MNKQERKQFLHGQILEYVAYMIKEVIKQTSLLVAMATIKKELV